jgi:alpha-1,2-mannosyltransferase
MLALSCLAIGRVNEVVAGVARRMTVAIGLVGVVLAVLVVLVDFQNFMDLRVYRAGGRAWVDGYSLYSNEFVRRSGVGLPFTYPPIAAILFTVLALIPMGVAVAVITAASLGALVGVAAIIVRQPRLAVLAAVAGGMLLEPVRLTLSFGQINLLLMVLVVADCLLPRTLWPRGLLIGIAAAVKLTPAVFVLFFAVRRQWRPVFLAAAGFAGATVIAWLVVGHDIPAYVRTVISDPGRLGGLTYAGNQSLNGFWHRFGLDPTLTAVLWAASAVVVVALGAYAARGARAAGDDIAALAAVAATGLLISPVSWSHHWVWALVAGIWLAPRLREWRWPARITVSFVMLLYVLPPHWILPNKDDREVGWTFWQHVVGNDFIWCALALLIAFALRWRARPAPLEARVEQRVDQPSAESAEPGGGQPRTSS